jgi:rhamnosyltransferase
MHLCGVVILYYPDEAVVERIRTYHQPLQQLFIIDNSDKANRSLLKPLLNQQNITYLHDGSNEGMAKRLNQAATLARAAGFDWLLTMDQDSFFDQDVLQNYIDCAFALEYADQVAMFGIEHDKQLFKKDKQCSALETTFLITSGSIVNLSLWPIIGGFNEALFIDHVDEDYCFRSLLKGYKIIKLDSFLLQHAIGVPSFHRSLKSLKATARSLHSPVRLYYMVRNFLYMRKQYSQQFKKEIGQFRRNLFNRFKNNLLYNKKRVQVLLYILKGFRDFHRNKMGKLK